MADSQLHSLGEIDYLLSLPGDGAMWSYDPDRVRLSPVVAGKAKEEGLDFPKTSRTRLSAVPTTTT
jgi:hypothetical protein